MLQELSVSLMSEGVRFAHVNIEENKELKARYEISI